MNESRPNRAQRAIAGLAFLALCATVGVATIPLTEGGEGSASARVLRVVATAPHEFVARVTFSDAEGEHHEVSLPITGTPFEPGERLRVRYVRDEPAQCRVDSVLRRFGWPVAAALLGLTGALLLIRRSA